MIQVTDLSASKDIRKDIGILLNPKNKSDQIEEIRSLSDNRDRGSYLYGASSNLIFKQGE